MKFFFPATLRSLIFSHTGFHTDSSRGRRDEGTKRRRDEETKRRRDEETKRRRDKGTKRQKDEETKRRRDEETKGQKKKGQRQKPFNGSAMNSPSTPPYCGSVAAALHLMNSQIRCGSCREKVLFIALRWMQPDRGMMWQAENSELAREFPAGTASKARQSRLHQAQGVFPVFVYSY